MSDRRNTPLLECPDRFWFRLLVYLQFLYLIVFSPNRDWLIAGIVIVTIYTLRSPNIVIFEDGIQIKVFWEKRFIAWSKIKKIRLTPKQVLISEGYFPIPLFLFYWRRNFAEIKNILLEKAKDKVIEYPFVLPF